VKMNLSVSTPIVCVLLVTLLSETAHARPPQWLLRYFFLAAFSKHLPLFFFQFYLISYLEKDIHKENNFKVFKNLAIYFQINLKIILLDYQSNYIGCTTWFLEYQIFLQHYSQYLNVLYIIILIIQHNYFQICIN